MWRVINSYVTLNQARDAISLTHSGVVTTVPMTGTMDTITEDHVMSPVTHTQQSDVREPEKTGAVVWWSNLGLIYISMRVKGKP